MPTYEWDPISRGWVDPPQSNMGASYAPEEILRKAYTLLAKDRARFSNANYAPYRGATTSPMSSLTQKARQLEQQYSSKPPPFNNKLRTVLSRPAEGLPVDSIIDRLRTSQAQFANRPALGALQNQFGAYYTPERGERFQRKTAKDINWGTSESRGKLANLDQTARTLNDTRNRELGKTLGVLQEEKQARRNALIGNLQEFGNQKHTYNNFVNDTNRAAFDKESKEPYKRMQLLEQALAPYQSMLNEGVHPDLQKSVFDNIAQALRAYGVDPAQPSNQWDSARTSSRYPGRLVADMPEEMKESHQLLERINPKIRDNYSDQRKDIVRRLMGAPSIGISTTADIDPLVRDQMRLLDRQAKERLKKDIGGLNAKYTQLGQYNSPQHIGEAEVRAREINRSVLEARHKLMEDALKGNLKTQASAGASDLENLHTLAKQGLKDYGGVLQDVRGLNKLGATKWRNDQDELEDLYKNYQNERMWEWPHMRNATRNEAHGEIFGNASTRGLSLDELSNLRSRYSELENERSQLSNQVQSLQGDIRTNQQYYDTRLAEFNRLEQARREQEAQRLRQQQEEERRRQQAAEEARRNPAPGSIDWHWQQFNRRRRGFGEGPGTGGYRQEGIQNSYPAYARALGMEMPNVSVVAGGTSYRYPPESIPAEIWTISENDFRRRFNTQRFGANPTAPQPQSDWDRFVQARNAWFIKAQARAPGEMIQNNPGLNDEANRFFAGTDPHYRSPELSEFANRLGITANRNHLYNRTSVTPFFNITEQQFNQRYRR